MKLSVLLADDDADVRLLTTCALEDAGWDVTEAGNGAEAVEALRRGHFDVVILDAVMPVMDGFESCRQIRADPRTGNVPIIFLTAQSTLPSLPDLPAGFIGHIRKPYDIDTLPQRIEELLRKASQEPDSTRGT